MTSRTPYDTYPQEMINRAEFNVGTPSSHGGVKIDRHIGRNALYNIGKTKISLNTVSQ